MIGGVTRRMLPHLSGVPSSPPCKQALSFHIWSLAIVPFVTYSRESYVRNHWFWPLQRSSASWILSLFLFLLVIMHLFAKMDSTLVYNAFCGCILLSFYCEWGARVCVILVHSSYWGNNKSQSAQQLRDENFSMCSRNSRDQSSDTQNCFNWIKSVDFNER